ERAHLNWQGASPSLFMNVFPPSFNGLFVLGMIEASGIGWQGRYEQAELIAAYLAAADDAPEAAARFRRRADAPWPDLTGGYDYLGLDRMSYYVNKDAYRRTVKRLLGTLPPTSARGPLLPPGLVAESTTAPTTATDTTIQTESGTA
ncbi:MAG: hypothetical protein ACRDT9_16410, partial [Agromyces sp.]